MAADRVLQHRDRQDFIRRMCHVNPGRCGQVEWREVHAGPKDRTSESRELKVEALSPIRQEGTISQILEGPAVYRAAIHA
jgi:hypothetical protein